MSELVFFLRIFCFFAESVERFLEKNRKNQKKNSPSQALQQVVARHGKPILLCEEDDDNSASYWFLGLFYLIQ